MGSRVRIGNRLLSLFFIALLLSVTLATLIELDARRSESEQRPLATMPHLAFTLEGLNAFPASFERFFNDHFGFRQQLVRLNSLLRVTLLGTSPIDRVVVGEDGWLFYAGERAMTTEPLLSGQLELWRVALEEKRAWLGTQGIDYVFMVAPDKHTVYPEYLPRTLRPQGRPTNLDLLIDYLKERSTIRVLDVRPQLLVAKASAPVYYKTDTHWNRFGAAVACEALLRRLAEENSAITPLPIPAPQKEFARKGGDMAAMLLMQNLLAESEVEPAITVGDAQLTERTEGRDGRMLTMGVNRHKDLPNAVVFHDSFFNNMKPYFAERFSRSVMVGRWLDQKFVRDIIEQERPDVVVEEIVERYLTGVPNSLPPPRTHSR